MTLEQIGIFLWCAFGATDGVMYLWRWQEHSDAAWVFAPVIIPAWSILGPIPMIVRKLQ